MAIEIAAIARSAGAGVVASTQPDTVPTSPSTESTVQSCTEIVEYQHEMTIDIGGRIISAMATFNDGIHAINDRLRALTEEELADMTPAERDVFVDDATQKMRAISQALTTDLPSFADSLDESLRAMRLISELEKGSEIPEAELADSAAVLLEYRGGFSAAANSITEFRDAFSLLPSMSVEFDTARAELTPLLHGLVCKLEDGRRLLASALARTAALLAEKS